MRNSWIGATLIFSMGCADTAEIQGLNSLYMGHSYFRRQAEAMNDYAQNAGIAEHASTTLFGGYNGSAYAIWEDPETQREIRTIWTRATPRCSE